MTDKSRSWAADSYNQVAAARLLAFPGSIWERALETGNIEFQDFCQSTRLGKFRNRFVSSATVPHLVEKRCHSLTVLRAESHMARLSVLREVR
ncbi:MAG: hypothetical protein KME30_14780 [Iphinoe sp. HA4291-MV1]|nr:hypothetical protein [Iphinoe sp. HA4291-MV1]